jgi:sterol desaturase/sphingolipid hydroxylase (fatty acid hydroxylase superfamily)
MLANRLEEVKVSNIMVSIWTGALFVISLFYLNEFDFSRGPVWFWFGAYIAYPLIGFWYAWTHRNRAR